MLSHHRHEVFLAHFSLYVHKSGLKPYSCHFYSIKTYINLLFDLVQMAAIFDFAHNAMFKVLSRNTTMSVMHENLIVDTKIMNLPLLCPHLLFDLAQIATILDLETFLNFKCHIPENQLFEKYMCQISSFYHNLKYGFSSKAHYHNLVALCRGFRTFRIIASSPSRSRFAP